MAETQNFKNHGRNDPAYHFIAVPILLLNVLFTIHVAIHHALHHGTDHLGVHIWLVIVSIALFVAAANMRVKDLVVQNRVIRLEEKLRYAAVLSAEANAAAQALTLQQVIALRFASDAELAGLIARTLKENLEPKQIKESIVTWRADLLRV